MLYLRKVDDIDGQSDVFAGCTEAEWSAKHIKGLYEILFAAYNSDELGFGKLLTKLWWSKVLLSKLILSRPCRLKRQQNYSENCQILNFLDGDFKLFIFYL